MTTQVQPSMINGGVTMSDLSALRALFIGMEVDFPFVPLEPWLPLFGQTLAAATYPALAAKFGVSSGNFTLPDHRGRVSAGADNMGGTSADRLTGGANGVNGDVLGAVGGLEKIILTLAQMPAHKHDVSTQSAGVHAHGIDNFTSFSGSGGDNQRWSPGGGTLTTQSAGAHVHPVNETSKGSDQAHANVQPTIVSYRCILAY